MILYLWVGIALTTVATRCVRMYKTGMAIAQITRCARLHGTLEWFAVARSDPDRSHS